MLQLAAALLLFCCCFVAVLAANGPPQVQCDTTKGTIVIEVHQELAPIGAKHFLELVEDNFYTNIAMYRCVERFLTQFGISQDHSKSHWHGKQIEDDVNLHRGIKKYDVSFAGGGPNTRSSQIFIAFEDLGFLGKEPWETPFGKVISGYDVVDKWYKGYGDISPFNKKGPDQQQLFRQGNKYIHENFPKIDFINECHVIDKDTLSSILYPDAQVPPPGEGDRPDTAADAEDLQVREGAEETETGVVSAEKVLSNLRARATPAEPVASGEKGGWLEETLLFLEANLTEFLFTDTVSPDGGIEKGLNYFRGVALLAVVVALGFGLVVVVVRGGYLRFGTHSKSK